MARRQTNAKNLSHSAHRVSGAAAAGSVARPLPTLLAGLGLHGLGNIEPIILAALATESPLLLIGPHGTAKSLLLVRIAEALGLSWRHYNASLVNFDDLIGFPLPGPNGSLDYVRTPAAIWGAGAVIFDEISRCRPDVQNKIFPIVHERRAQGLLLEDLRHRWAAMNPPSDDGQDGYVGSEPLDPALADRFAFVVEMPRWGSLSEAEQFAILATRPDAEVPEAARAAFARAVAAARAAIPAVSRGFGESLPAYARTLIGLLEQAGLSLSPRRGGMLVRGIAAIHAARLAIDPSAAPADSAWITLQAGLPQRAQGIEIPEGKVLAAHREAWRLATIAPDDPVRALIAEADPLRRITLAVAAPRLSRAEFSGLVADSFAAVPPGARAAVALHLFGTGAVGRLHAAVAEQVGALHAHIARSPIIAETMAPGGRRFSAWKHVRQLLAKLDPAKPDDQLTANVLAQAFAAGDIKSADGADAVLAAWREARQALGTEVPL